MDEGRWPRGQKSFIRGHAEIAAHGRVVGWYAAKVGEVLGLAQPLCERLRVAGSLHDIGKTRLPPQILAKPGPLDPAEWRAVREHPTVGAGLLAAEGMDEIGAWVLAHHERPDGGGYPHGRRAAEIPLEARILAVADAYEAMTANRPYRPALHHAVAIEELTEGAGTQFDPEVVEAFLEVLASLQAPRTPKRGGTRTPKGLM